MARSSARVFSDRGRRMTGWEPERRYDPTAHRRKIGRGEQPSKPHPQQDFGQPWQPYGQPPPQQPRRATRGQASSGTGAGGGGRRKVKVVAIVAGGFVLLLMIIGIANPGGKST